MLEAEWVLRGNYGLARQPLLETLRAFLALPRIIAQDPESSVAALDWAEHGMDFADALHLAGAAGCDAFASFDRALKRTAAKLGAPEVRAP